MLMRELEYVYSHSARDIQSCNAEIANLRDTTSELSALVQKQEAHINNLNGVVQNLQAELSRLELEVQSLATRDNIINEDEWQVSF